MVKTRFRHIYIVQPTHDFSALVPMAQELRFLTTGYEPIDNLSNVIAKALETFDPEHDALVSVGRSNATLITGLMLGIKFPDDHIWIGVYSPNKSKEGYKWLKT